MKKSLIVLLVLAGAVSVSAQGFRQLEIRGGYLNPKGTASGLILGGSYGFAFDERVSLSMGVDFFKKNYTKETKIAESVSPSGVVENTIQKELEYNTFLMPFTAAIDIRFPLQRGMCWYAGAGLSYQFLFNTENNLEEGVKEKRNYHGFGWIFRAGLEYTLGSRSALLMEAFYNSAKLKGNEDKVENLPVWDEVNVSGFGVRAGVRLEFF